MRTTTKRVLSTPLFLCYLMLWPFALLGLLYGVIEEWFGVGRKCYRDLKDLWDPKNNDPEYRR